MNAIVQKKQSMTVKPLLIVLMGETFVEISNQLGNFDDWIKHILHDQDIEVIHPKKQILPNPLHYAGIILTGSHAMVTDREEWSKKVADWLYICRKLNCPILGICYGHQLIAQTFGGWVEANPNGLELGTHEIQLHDQAKKDRLFQSVTQSFKANLVHYQSVTQLPSGAVVLASNTHDQHQAYRLGDRIWGVQFHPEFNQQAMQAYVNVLTAQAHACDEQEITLQSHRSIQETVTAQKILQNFAVTCYEMAQCDLK